MHFYLNKTKLELMSWKKFLRPTKGKIILTIVLFFFYLWSALICPAMQAMCPVDANTPGAVEEYPGRFFIRAKHIPFSCNQVCTDAEYTHALVNSVVFNLIIPFIVIYVISCLIVWIYNKFRKK